MRNNQISTGSDYGYKSNLFALAESGGSAVLIFPLLIFIKKIANTTYCGPPFFHVLRYLDISQSKKMNLGAMLITQKINLQTSTISCHHNQFTGFNRENYH
jgi:hypothetical protein